MFEDRSSRPGHPLIQQIIPCPVLKQSHLFHNYCDLQNPGSNVRVLSCFTGSITTSTDPVWERNQRMVSLDYVRFLFS